MITDEAQFSAWADKRDERKYGRLLLNRVFRAVITDVDRSLAPLYQVQIRRTGENTPDGAWYPSYEAGYQPSLGDEVDLMWRDDTVAYVIQPRGPGVLVATATPLAPPVIVGSAGAASVSFSNIPQGFNVLQIWGRYGVDIASLQLLHVQYNDDVSGSYNSELLQATESGPPVCANVGGSNINKGVLGTCSCTAYQTLTAISCELPGYSALIPMLMSSRSARMDLNGPTGRTIDFYTSGWVVNPRQAVTKIKLFPANGNFIAGTRIYLYGM
jgi:hypothetical protein